MQASGRKEGSTGLTNSLPAEKDSWLPLWKQGESQLLATPDLAQCLQWLLAPLSAGLVDGRHLHQPKSVAVLVL